MIQSFSSESFVFIEIVFFQGPNCKRAPRKTFCKTRETESFQSFFLVLRIDVWVQRLLCNSPPSWAEEEELLWYVPLFPAPTSVYQLLEEKRSALWSLLSCSKLLPSSITIMERNSVFESQFLPRTCPRFDAMDHLLCILRKKAYVLHWIQFELLDLHPPTVKTVYMYTI